MTDLLCDIKNLLQTRGYHGELLEEVLIVIKSALEHGTSLSEMQARIDRHLKSGKDSSDQIEMLMREDYSTAVQIMSCATEGLSMSEEEYERMCNY